MPVDITKLAQERIDSSLGMTAVFKAAAAFDTEEQARLRKMTNPAVDLVSGTAASFALQEKQYLRALLGPALNSMRSMTDKFALQEKQYLRALLNPTLDSVRDVAARLGMADEEPLRRQMALARNVRSSVDRLLEDELRQRERYMEMLPPSTASAIEAVFQRNRELERMVAFLAPSPTVLDEVAVANKMLAEVMRLANPVRDLLDRARIEQTLDAPWFAQMESAAKLASRFADTWRVDSESDADVDWTALDRHLEEVEAAIQQLPGEVQVDPQRQQPRITRDQWQMVFTVFGVLLALLAYMESLQQGRFARQQAAETHAFEEQVRADELAFHRHLISTIENLAKHLPDQTVCYVVRTRPVPVKSAITRGIYLGTAYPNQVVTATGRRGRWIKIRFHDNLEEREVEGWVLKQYLMRQSGE